MKGSDNVFPKVLFSEGAAPATPSAGEVKVYAKTDGRVYSKDDAGVETILGSATTRAVVTAVTPSAGTATFDYALGDYFTVAPMANITTIAFSNLPASPAAITLTISFTQDTTPRTVAWPASFKWAGAAPSVSTGSGDIDMLIITSFDQGTTWHASLGKDFA